MSWPPGREAHYGEYVAEYRRMRDAWGEERVCVTVRDQKTRFHFEMDALERFATTPVAKGLYAKPLDEQHPDFVERFKRFTAASHVGMNRDGSKVTQVHFAFSRQKPGDVLAKQQMWIPHEAIKEFSVRGLLYEQELGHTKRWYPLVRVVGLGEPEGSGVVQVLTSVEDKGGARERAQLRADRSVEQVLWPYPFRERMETGTQFTVRGGEGGFGYGKIGIWIERELMKRDREGHVYVVGLWHERSCEPYPTMAVRYESPHEHNQRWREMLVYPEGGKREPGNPKSVEYLLIAKSRNRPGHGTVQELFGAEVERAVAKLHSLEEMHRLQKELHDLSQHQLPRGFRCNP